MPPSNIVNRFSEPVISGGTPKINSRNSRPLLSISGKPSTPGSSLVQTSSTVKFGAPIDLTLDNENTSYSRITTTPLENVSSSRQNQLANSYTAGPYKSHEYSLPVSEDKSIAHIILSDDEDMEYINLPTTRKTENTLAVYNDNDDDDDFNDQDLEELKDVTSKYFSKSTSYRADEPNIPTKPDVPFKSPSLNNNSISSDISDSKDNGQLHNSLSKQKLIEPSKSILTFKSSIEQFKADTSPVIKTPYESTPNRPEAVPQVPGTTSSKLSNRNANAQLLSAHTSSMQEIISQTPPIPIEKVSGETAILSSNPASDGNYTLKQTSQPPSSLNSIESDAFLLQAIIGYQAHIIDTLTQKTNLALSEVNRIRLEYPSIINTKFDIDMDILSTDLEGSQNKLKRLQEERSNQLESANNSILMSPIRDRKKSEKDEKINYEEFHEEHEVVTLSSDDEDELKDSFNTSKAEFFDIESSDIELLRDLDAITKGKPGGNELSDDSDVDIEQTTKVNNSNNTYLSQYNDDIVDEDEVVEYDPYVLVNPAAPGEVDNDSHLTIPSQPTATGTRNSEPKVYPWTNEVFSTLRTSFKLSGFRQNQLEAINATLNGDDVLVLMPTGGGKSLCYQLPAVIKSGKTSGVTVVISPLLSLMQDQVQQLKEKNIRAEMINSQLTAEEKKFNRNLLFNNLLDLVYLSPELMRMSMMLTGLKKLHRQGQIARIVIDEAHCVSSWGHDFRPQYKELEMIQSEFPGVPIIALTATATSLVQLDIRRCLRNTCLVFKQTFNRPNLSYEIRRSSRVSKDNNTVYPSITKIMDKYRNQTGIIYCRTQSQCEELAKRLKNDGYLVEYYHGGLDTESRVRIQSQWQAGQIKAVCATVAFGMGIDKPDVRYVIHESMPRTMEGYYQETGRAGRDRQPSECVMFYSFHDFMSLICAIDRDRDLSYERKQHQKELLNNMMQYCENEVDCRRRIILNYFNESLPRSDICKKSCDNCRERSKKNITNVDITSIAKDFVQLVSYIQKDGVSPSHCISVYRGSKIKKILELGHDNAPAFGNGKSKTPHELERIISHLLQKGILKDIPKENKKFGGATATIYKGPEGDKVLQGRFQVIMQFVAPKAGSASETGNTSHSNKRRKFPDNTQDDLNMFAEENDGSSYGRTNVTKKRKSTTTKATRMTTTTNGRPNNPHIRAMPI